MTHSFCGPPVAFNLQSWMRTVAQVIGCTLAPLAGPPLPTYFSLTSGLGPSGVSLCPLSWPGQGRRAGPARHLPPFCLCPAPRWAGAAPPGLHRGCGSADSSRGAFVSGALIRVFGLWSPPLPAFCPRGPHCGQAHSPCPEELPCPPLSSPPCPDDPGGPSWSPRMAGSSLPALA